MFLAPIVALAGTAVSAAGTIMGARAQASALEYQAAVARQKGMAEKAAAQRDSLDTSRKTQFALSTLQARSAASGAGADDPTVASLAGDIAGRGFYQSALQMWQGEEAQWGAETQARGEEATASAYKTYGTMSALGTILGGAGSLLGKYGGSLGLGSSGSGSTLPNSNTATAVDSPYPRNMYDQLYPWMYGNG